MQDSRSNPGVPLRLWAYIALTGVGGAAWLAYLVAQVEWELSTWGELGLFWALVVVAGSFPLPVAPRVKATVTTAVLFSAALLLEPGVAALAGVAGTVAYSLVLRFSSEKLLLPWYKYPFNAGETALTVGLTAAMFNALSTGDGVLAVAVAPAAALMYLVNTALVSGAASLQLGLNPWRLWWTGTVENGLAELSLLAFGFLGAVVYRESPWTVIALFIPVAVIYIAFSRLAWSNVQLEEALRKLESLQGHILSTSKLASIGALSLDLAHQIKNPLAVLLGRLEELQDSEGLREGSKGRRHLDIATQAGWRIQELTHTFASIGQQRWVEQDISVLLDEAFGMAGLRNRKGITIQRNYSAGSLKVMGNPVLIREALSNIFTNSMEAVADEGGLITVGASPVDGVVVVRISDNGAGIPKKEMAHIFEPFHSTKPMGHGLGLFACKHILEMHHGSVKVESVEGEGTCVTVSLPAAVQLGQDQEGGIDSLLAVQS